MPMPGANTHHVVFPQNIARGLSRATLVGCPQNPCENAIRIVVNDSCVNTTASYESSSAPSNMKVFWRPHCAGVLLSMFRNGGPAGQFDLSLRARLNAAL